MEITVTELQHANSFTLQTRMKQQATSVIKIRTPLVKVVSVPILIKAMAVTRIRKATPLTIHNRDQL